MLNNATKISVINIENQRRSAPNSRGIRMIIMPLTTAPLANEAIVERFGFIIAWK